MNTRSAATAGTTSGEARRNRLDRVLAARQDQGRTALIVYITAGFPDLATSRRLIPALLEAGVDVVELGLPFSDPLADGPTIQRASHLALQRGVRVADVLDLARTARAEGVAGPLVLMSYVNPLLATGLLEEPRRLMESGFDGLIVPDLPSLESQRWEAACEGVGLRWIPFLTPTSPEARIRQVTGREGGFIYCVSLTGVTGARRSLPPSAVELLTRVRGRSRRPVAVGFGVSGPEAARALAQYADAVIVGSALLDRIFAAEAEGANPVRAAQELVSDLRKALDDR
ncbi:MAG TPA: tryptophan synthase subunit alpha [Bacillota bacterium]